MNCLRLFIKKEIEIWEKVMSVYKLENASAYLFHSVSGALQRNAAMKLNGFVINILKRRLHICLNPLWGVFLDKIMVINR